MAPEARATNTGGSGERLTADHVAARVPLEATSIEAASSLPNTSLSTSLPCRWHHQLLRRRRRRRPLPLRSIVWSLVLCLAGLRAAAADLQEHTSRAYDRYAEEVTRTFLERARGSGASTADGAPSRRAPAPRDGEVIVRPGGQDGIIAVPGGLLHHWIGASFIAGVTLEEALDVSYAYDHYQAFYKPVIASTLLGRDGNTHHVLLRIREAAAGLSAVLDVTARVQYFYPGSGSVYSVSTSGEIREVKDPGSPQERQLPAGRDSGYLWRAVTLNRLIERDHGVFIEMETLGLSRSFPPMLGWFIEPIARRLGRKSVELSLQEFRSAVHARKRRLTPST